MLCVRVVFAAEHLVMDLWIRSATWRAYKIIVAKEIIDALYSRMILVFHKAMVTAILDKNLNICL